MLTDRICKAARPAEKPVKHFDQHGLHLLVRPTGYKSWRMKYRFGGKEKQLSFGPYPEVTLAKARDLMFEARATLRAGIDPGRVKAGGGDAEQKTFRTATEMWLSLQREGWKPKNTATVTGRIEADLYPALASRPLTEIRPRELVELLQAVQERGAIEVAHRLRSYISAIYECAIALEWALHDPAASIGKALKPVKAKNHPALRSIADLQALMGALERAPGQPATKLASRLLALTATRPGSVRQATCDQFTGLDGEEPIWRIPAANMKLELAQSEQEAFDFIVPLSQHAVDVVKTAIAFSGRRKYLFPSTRYSHRPISDNALNVAYRRTDFAGRHVPHGWRASFSTIMNERAAELDRPGDRAVIDLMLAHKPQGVEAVYNRAAYMTRRRQIAQEWADLLLNGMPSAQSLLEGPRKS